jgi:hypothetical protein
MIRPDRCSPPQLSERSSLRLLPLHLAFCFSLSLDRHRQDAVELSRHPLVPPRRPPFPFLVLSDRSQHSPPPDSRNRGGQSTRAAQAVDQGGGPGRVRHPSVRLDLPSGAFPLPLAPSVPHEVKVLIPNHSDSALFDVPRPPYTVSTTRPIKSSSARSSTSRREVVPRIARTVPSRRSTLTRSGSRRRSSPMWTRCWRTSCSP